MKEPIEIDLKELFLFLFWIIAVVSSILWGNVIHHEGEGIWILFLPIIWVLFVSQFVVMEYFTRLADFIGIKEKHQEASAVLFILFIYLIIFIRMPMDCEY